MMTFDRLGIGCTFHVYNISIIKCIRKIAFLHTLQNVLILFSIPFFLFSRFVNPAKNFKHMTFFLGGEGISWFLYVNVNFSLTFFIYLHIIKYRIDCSFCIFLQWWYLLTFLDIWQTQIENTDVWWIPVLARFYSEKIVLQDCLCIGNYQIEKKRKHDDCPTVAYKWRVVILQHLIDNISFAGLVII